EDRHARFLSVPAVRHWDTMGGTNLGSSRTNPFGKGRDLSAVVARNIEGLGLDALVAIGGEDTLGVARRLHGMGIRVVGIPKTIDGDLPGTEYSLGFETAVSIVTEEMDRIRTTAGSHSRIFVIETMGRHAGHLALQGGLSGGAYVILIPEVPFNVTRIVHLLQGRKNLGVRYSLVVVAEGAFPEGFAGPITSGQTRDTGFEHMALGGVGEFLAAQIAAATDWDLRSINLSHIQRGGAPVAFDRRLGRLFGIAAMDLVEQGSFGRMVSWRHGRVTSSPLEVLDEGLHLVDVEAAYDRKRYNGKRGLLVDRAAARGGAA
ncbi:MAG: ATP-dependent 6-phosphofructokinase, partial [Deltaproteobacteria bacterium]|nr:ATP-dependent 6-phosphofructokinase [Deltaproteobacteria bacterium]